MPITHAEPLRILQKEALALFPPLQAHAEPVEAPRVEHDFLLLLVEECSDVERLPLPALKDRAAAVIGVASDAPACRATITRARRRLRAHGAALGAHELVLAPEAFGVLGLESDGQREKLEILLRTLVLDAERLRLRREGWEEPDGTR